MNHLLSLNSYHYVRGGADAVYFEHARLFEANGWRNSYFAMHHDENLPCDTSRWFAENIDYHKPASPVRKAVHAMRIVYSIEAQRKLACLLDEVQVDIAHVHNIYHHQSPSVLVELKRRGIPAVMTAHDLKIACPNTRMMTGGALCERCKGGRVWHATVRRCIKDSLLASALVSAESAVHKLFDLYDRTLDRIVAPSRFYRDKLIEWGWNGEKIVHIPNFVTVDEAVPPRIGGGHLLYFGRLAEEKGLATLVRAAARAGVKVQIAGTGPQADDLARLAAEIKAPVDFLGFLSGPALWEAVDAARAIVLPSEWYENGPMSVIEAFGRGKPLVGAAIGGIPELIEERQTGWTFASGNIEDSGEGALRRDGDTGRSACRDGVGHAPEGGGGLLPRRVLPAHDRPLSGARSLTVPSPLATSRSEARAAMNGPP